MWGRADRTFLWFVVLGVIAIVCALQLTFWGTIGAVVAGLLSFITAALWIRRWWHTRRPFKDIQCWLKDGEESYPEKRDIQQGTAFSYFESIDPIRGRNVKLNMRPGKYHIWLELLPRLSVKVVEVNLRLLGNRKLDEAVCPEVLRFEDAYQKKGTEYFHQQDMDGGITFWYVPPKQVDGSHAVDYIATFSTKAPWKGKLSLRFQIESIQTRPVRIHCIVG